MKRICNYFDPTIISKNYNWVINPFQNLLSLTNEEKLIELISDLGLHEIFKNNKNKGQFWIKV